MTELDQSPAQMRKSSAILTAARTHFSSHGFEATKLSDVAQDAGVAVGTIYLRYKGKTELLRGVLDDVEASFCDAIDTPVVWAEPFPERFAVIITAILDTARQQSDLAKLMALTAFAPHAPRSDKQNVLQKIQEHIADGASRGDLRGDLDLPLVSRMAHGLVDGALRELMSNPDRNPVETAECIADAYTRWLVRG